MGTRIDSRPTRRITSSGACSYTWGSFMSIDLRSQCARGATALSRRLYAAVKRATALRLVLLLGRLPELRRRHDLRLRRLQRLLRPLDLARNLRQPLRGAVL